MNTLIIDVDNLNDLSLLQTIAQRMGFTTKVLASKQEEALTTAKSRKKAKESLLKDIETGLQEVKLAQEGKLQLKSLREILQDE